MRFASAILLCSSLSLLSCAPYTKGTGHGDHPPRLAAALDAAGSNRSELVEVLDHYRNEGDSLKLRAAEYLIENMQGKRYVVFDLRDSTGASVPFNCLDHPDYETMITALDSIEAARGLIDFESVDSLGDIEMIEADFLIENIDLAFSAWRKRPWAQHLSFENFCDYVLPYRGSEEPLERWRPYFVDRYAGLAKRMENPEDPVEAARLINEEIMGWFGFDPRFYCHPSDQSLSDMLENRLGRCEDMTNLAIYAMRANGLAVTSDHTPHWADTGNNHAWNAIIDSGGNAVMFMGCESHPGDYGLGNRLAKVYRKTYAEQPNSLALIKPDWEEVPRRLAGKSYADVTADYTDVTDVAVRLTSPVPDSVSYAYICVFNSGEWKAVDWGEIDERSVLFTDIGVNIAYLPTYYVEGELLPAGPPFILESSGETRSLIPGPSIPKPMRLISTTKRIELSSTDGVEETLFEPGTDYLLYLWKDGWVEVGSGVSDGGPMSFEGVPDGGLYWLTAEGSRKEERIFTYEDGSQIWW